MRSLTVLYDAHCGLCRRAKTWLAGQPTFVELEFLPAGSIAARARFPELDPAQTLNDLTVVGDGGEVYHGDGAWLMCLWALVDYREWALTFSGLLRPAFRLGVDAISRLRQTGACDGSCGVLPTS